MEIRDQSEPRLEKSITSIIRELILSFSGLVRSEINLAKVEMSQNARDIGKRAGTAVGFGIVAWLGVQALVAFLIIGLGQLIGNYWLSSLIVGLLLAVPGALLAMNAIKKISETPKLPVATESLQNDKEFIAGRVQHLNETIKKETLNGQRAS